MSDNNLRAKVREKIAYCLTAGLLGETAAIIAGKFVGIEVASTEVLMLGGFMGMILVYYFGGEQSREKPDS
ncbi:hypothetical protein ES702_03083 [subsurface metagenome]